ncbi:Rpn family recombination-promoting nuclease/putative transposase [Dyadobacter aurulentus]|uniref:Rpn family recombination-promoting nuclease/putative transposase n=1 Tax=Dyadobacter sp. UC 10 TaxID=2605428 RepID=UPI0011F39A7D|nr:Rpn family recombination-promoting nuclease/putative transposase [Dyadobacter sp. UC 10]KAA0992850.1 Rpn family recombination-promoting nuclease/putative transposase [Dyadobacter sp. UC 10]
MHIFKPGRFIDPFTDFGFKRIFGSEPNKDLLIDFLNQLFEGEKCIVDLVYDRTERSGPLSADRKVIFDLLCTGVDGEQFIIEMQRIRQEFFKDRCLYYVSSLIRDQVPLTTQKWDYRLKPVYLIGIMDFCFDSATKLDFISRVTLKDENGQAFYDKLGFIYVQIPNFTKREEELKSELDNWLFLLKHMNNIDKLPLFLRRPIFKKLFDIAEVSNLNKQEKMAYDASLKQARDWYAVTEYARKEGLKAGIEQGKELGIEEGIHSGKLETARKMKQKGLSDELIMDVTGLSAEQIGAL